MDKYYKAEDIQELITACMWRMTLTKERNGEGFVEYDKKVLDVDELKKRLSTLPTIEVSEDTISRANAIEAVKDVSENYTGKGKRDYYPHIDFIVDALKYVEPSVIPQPKEGEWIDRDGWKFCSECDNRADKQANGVAIEPLCTNYCCECGAKMKGADDE